MIDKEELLKTIFLLEKYERQFNRHFRMDAYNHELKIATIHYQSSLSHGDYLPLKFQEIDIYLKSKFSGLDIDWIKIPPRIRHEFCANWGSKKAVEFNHD